MKTCTWYWDKSPLMTQCGQSAFWLNYAGLHNIHDFRAKLRYCWHCGGMVKIIFSGDEVDGLSASVQQNQEISVPASAGPLHRGCSGAEIKP